MNRRLRILHIGNGTAFKIRAIADAMVQRGHDVHMLPIPPGDGSWDGVTWHRLPEPAMPAQAKVLARFLQARRFARRLKPDVVVAHNACGPGWYGAAVGLHPLVIHAYGGDLLPEQYAGRPAIQRRLTAWSCRAADRIVVTGRHMVHAARSLGVPADRLVVLPRGVDLHRYRPGMDTTSLRQGLGLGPGTPVILSPRYQVDEALYNLDVVVDAVARVRERFPEAVCIQLYDPLREQGRARLQAHAAERGLGSAYRLHPSVDNAAMPLFYNLADVVVSVPSSDGFPVTVLEASACAVPLVVSDLPFCGEWFDSGTNGLVVPVRDAAALANALAEILASPDRACEMGTACRHLVERRADARTCMDDLEAAYQDVLARREAGRRDS